MSTFFFLFLFNLLIRFLLKFSLIFINLNGKNRYYSGARSNHDPFESFEKDPSSDHWWTDWLGVLIGSWRGLSSSCYKLVIQDSQMNLKSFLQSKHASRVLYAKQFSSEIATRFDTYETINVNWQACLIVNCKKNKDERELEEKASG